MDSSVYVRGELEKFGLSKKQAEIYILLVGHKELRIQEIAKLASIPRSSVYESLNKLHEFGLIEEILDDNFKIIKPYPVSSIRHRLNEKILEFQTQASNLSKLEKALILLPSTDTSPITVRYYKGRSGARQLLWNSLNTSNTVFVLSSFGRSEFVGKKFYMDFVEQSYSRNIDEKVLINPTDRALGLIKRDHGTPIARSDIDKIKVLEEDTILVNGDTLIYDNIYAHIYFDTEEITGFEIESKHFVETQRTIFDTLWKTARPVKELLSI